ncbi:MAG TPA: hypothetical protein VF518_04220 [Polyangia bacterium]
MGGVGLAGGVDGFADAGGAAAGEAGGAAALGGVDVAGGADGFADAGGATEREAGGATGADGVGGVGLAGGAAGFAGAGGAAEDEAVVATGAAAALAGVDLDGCEGGDSAGKGLANRAGMGNDGGAAMPKMVLLDPGASIDFPAAGQVRVSGRCCFPQWGQGFASGFTAGSAQDYTLASQGGGEILPDYPKIHGSRTAFAANAGAWHPVADV